MNALAQPQTRELGGGKCGHVSRPDEGVAGCQSTPGHARSPGQHCHTHHPETALCQYCGEFACSLPHAAGAGAGAAAGAGAGSAYGLAGAAAGAAVPQAGAAHEGAQTGAAGAAQVATGAQQRVFFTGRQHFLAQALSSQATSSTATPNRILTLRIDLFLEFGGGSGDRVRAVRSRPFIRKGVGPSRTVRTRLKCRLLAGLSQVRRSGCRTRAKLAPCDRYTDPMLHDCRRWRGSFTTPPHHVGRIRSPRLRCRRPGKFPLPSTFVRAPRSP